MGKLSRFLPITLVKRDGASAHFSWRRTYKCGEIKAGSSCMKRNRSGPRSATLYPAGTLCRRPPQPRWKQSQSGRSIYSSLLDSAPGQFVNSSFLFNSSNVSFCCNGDDSEVVDLNNPPNVPIHRLLPHPRSETMAH